VGVEVVVEEAEAEEVAEAAAEEAEAAVEVEGAEVVVVLSAVSTKYLARYIYL
jgi:hypothetical protein